MFAGFQSGVETLKSLIIMLALVDKEISVENAVKLARLEQEFQVHLPQECTFLKSNYLMKSKSHQSFTPLYYVLTMIHSADFGIFSTCICSKIVVTFIYLWIVFLCDIKMPL